VSRARIAVIVSGFPRRSETFAINELLALDARGLLAGVFATKPGDGGAAQPGIDRLLPKTRILDAATPQEQGAQAARLLAAEEISGVHAYFAHTPGEVAMEAAARLDVPFGFSLHARDVRKADPEALVDRAHRAACVIACNHAVAGDLHRMGGRAHVVPHGVDLERFHPTPDPHACGLRLLAIGRLIEKKGFDVLVDAVARTPVASLRIIGEGPLRSALEDRIRALGAGDRITLAGARTHAELPDEYADAHAVAVPSIVDATGDQDGLPNVVLEAMASGRAVVATNVGAITSGVRHGETGLVVPSRDVDALSRAIEQLAARPEWRAAMGRRARRIVEREFDVRQCAGAFARLLENAYA